MDWLFRFLTRQIRNTEHTVMTFIAAVIPWLVPLIPAYLTGYHVITELRLPEWTGWVIGAVVEGLGLASMSKIVAFWENNRRYKKDTNKMPITVPAFTYIWYLAVVIVVNVLLEKESGASALRIWTIAILASLSVPTAALIAVTSIWTERILTKEAEKAAGNSETYSESSESTVKSKEVSESFPKDWRKLRPILTEDDLRVFAFLSPSNVRELSLKYDVTEKTIQNWRTHARRELNIKE